jgi:outer membrane protein assembly factor BamB
MRHGLAAVAALVVPLLAQAQETGMFRGDPSHLGRYAGGGSAIVGIQWRFETQGDVISSPTVVGNVVYVGSGDGHLYALDLLSGRVNWSYDAGSPIASSPAVAERTVFVGTRAGRFLGLDAASGAVRWQLATGADLPLPWGHESGDVYTSSPVYALGALVFGAGDGSVYAVDPGTGAIRWQAQTRGRVRATPAVSDGAVYVGSFDGYVYSFDLATGHQRWRFATEGASLESAKFGFDRRSVQSSAAVANGTVYVGARDGFLYAIDAATGRLRWRFDHRVSWINSSPAVVDGVVYDGSSDAAFVQAVDAASGRELWRQPVGAIVWSSPAVAGEELYFGDGAGRIHVAARGSGRELAAFRTGSAIFGSPTISGNLLIAGSTDGAVYAVRLSDGPPILRAVFFDSSYARLNRTPNAPDIAAYLSHRGYDVVDGRTVDAFLRARLADQAPSVLVFAMDALPPTLATASPDSSLMRRYLDRGGKVVWVGVPPMLWQRKPGGNPDLKDITWSGPGELLAVPHDAAIFDTRGVRATTDGLRWGLPARSRGSWGVAPAGVSLVLGVDEWGLASSWVKSYGGAEGTGFVRVPADNLLSLYVIAEYRPAPTSSRLQSPTQNRQ